ncbi:MAG: SagB/ThcOx family dehydrogenase, partial [Actinomycetota bacterium]|nr:SagB/ThcOx family dehydrogenase [Actinomycetota bacterium]
PDLVRRRGSTRRFDPTAVAPGALLGEALGWATRPVPGDFLPAGATLLEHHLAVHAVDDVPPGLYRWSAAGLERMHEGDVRALGRHLCLDQDLGGDGCYTVFHCADDRVTGALGARGYRAAQLEAGVVAGRLHLTACALGFGASGLTFFDDQVRRAFGTDAWPMLVTAVGAPAYRSKPGGLPGRPTPLSPT